MADDGNMNANNGPRSFPQLEGLAAIAARVRQGVLDKTQNINQFNDEIKEKIRALDALSVGILEKIRELCRKALECNSIIDEKTREITEINRRLAEVTQAQAQSAQQVQTLTEELARAREDSSQSGPLREEINTLRKKIQNQTTEIELLTRGIDDANGVIGQAVTELNKPHDTAELQTLLGALEAHIREIDTGSNCANNSASGNNSVSGNNSASGNNSGSGSSSIMGRAASVNDLRPMSPVPGFNPRFVSRSQDRNDDDRDDGFSSNSNPVAERPGRHRLLELARNAPAATTSEFAHGPARRNGLLQGRLEPLSTRPFLPGGPSDGKSFHTRDVGRGGKKRTKKGGYKYRTTRRTKIVSSSSRRPKSSAGKRGGKRRTRGIKALIV